jgi:two-component system, OmpR family, phosphate regulon response regulator PhoB
MSTVTGGASADAEARARFGLPEPPDPEPIDYERDTKAPPYAVLVIEPVVEIARYLEGLLTGQGFAVATEPDGPSGVERIGQEAFDLVISEYVLPGLLGDEVFRRVRADARTRTLPILMLTQIAEPVTLSGAMTAGADDYVLKPFDPFELTARARAAIRRRAN